MVVGIVHASWYVEVDAYCGGGRVAGVVDVKVVSQVGGCVELLKASAWDFGVDLLNDGLDGCKGVNAQRPHK